MVQPNSMWQSHMYLIGVCYYQIYLKIGLIFFKKEKWDCWLLKYSYLANSDLLLKQDL